MDSPFVVPPNRHSVRLLTYNYDAAGPYFVTLCTLEREPTIGAINADAVVLSGLGQIVHDEWSCLPDLQTGVTIDTFVVMPNHTHALLYLRGHDWEAVERADQKDFGSMTRTRHSLGLCIAVFKATTVRRAHKESSLEAPTFRCARYGSRPMPQAASPCARTTMQQTGPR